MSLVSRIASRTPHQVRSRALAKTLVYRTLMVLITVLVALLVTGDLAAALNIGLIANAIKTVTYYLHERAWDRISWGVASATAGE